MIKDKIKKDLEETIKKVAGQKPESLDLEHPQSPEHGDYSSNWAMVGFKQLESKLSETNSPLELAQKISQEFPQKDYLQRVEAIEPGFINFHLSPLYLASETKKIASSKDYGRGDWGKDKKVLVEYSSPNIARRFGVGHLRSTIIGQALRNLYEFSGWKTVGDNHLGDWGTQFGMIIAGVKEKGVDVSSMSVSELEKIYVEYNKKAKEDKEYKDKARKAFLDLENGEEKVRRIWRDAVKISMEEFKKIYDLLGVDIEYAYGESHYEELMKEVVEEIKEKLAVRGKRGAWIVEFEDLPPAMLLKSDGATTYFTRDMATIKFRLEEPELKSDLYIYEVGAEQKLHFKQVFRTAEKMGWAKREKFIHVAHGLILGKDGKKLSTRRGTSLKLEDWLNKIIDKAREVNPETAQRVGVGAVKYMDLKQHPGKNYTFDIERALSLEGDSGPYLQYTYVRAKSILRKADVKNELRTDGYVPQNEELALMRKFYQFPEVVEKAAKTYNPSLLCNYLFDLAQEFNSFYEKVPVLSAKNKVSKNMRLNIVKASSLIIKEGLHLLGIETPEKM